MELLLWAAGAAVLLLVLGLLAGRRQRRNRPGAPHQPPSSGTAANESPVTRAWTFGGGSPGSGW
ncbi:hypothetical protein [Blastococcus sp. SYSU DS0617]